jgi:hypothetical protein
MRARAAGRWEGGLETVCDVLFCSPCCSTTLNQLLAKGQLNFESVQQLATPELAQQFVASRRDELLELQRSLLGFEDIALQEGLKPSESEIEVSTLAL